jgi:anti-sigma-K factor RskA
MNHNEAYELIYEYLFGALDPATHAAVEAHLSGGCELCEQRLLDLGEVSVALAEAAPQKTPPASVKLGLMQTIARERAKAPTSTPTPIITTHTTSLWPRLVAVMGVAASIALIFWVNTLRSDLAETRSALETTQQQLGHLVRNESVQKDAAYLFGLPCTQMVHLNGVAPNEASFANVVMHPHEDFAVAYIYRMPPPPADKEYQLWFEMDGKPVSAGMFTVDDNGGAMIKLQKLPDPFAIKSFQVTIEPMGGMPEPTGMMYLDGTNTIVHMDDTH